MDTGIFLQGELDFLYGKISTCKNCKAALVEQKHFALAFVLSGNGKLDIEYKMYELEKDYIFALYPGGKMRLRGEGMRYAIIEFSGKGCEIYLEYMGFSSDSPVKRSSIPCEAYLSMTEEIIRLPSSCLEEQMIKTGMLYRMFSLLVESRRIEPHNGAAKYDYPQEVYVDTLKEYISRQYSCVRISDLAEYLGVNRSYLSVVFKNETGISPQKYLIDFRMEKAAEMLLTGDMPIKQISRRVGYADPFTFSKAFKVHFGMPPSAYREKLKAGENACAQL